MSMPAPVPLVPAPIGAPVLTFGPTPNQMGMDTFSEEQELCGCCDDGETCCLAFFCGCCAHGMLCHDIQEQGYTEHCLIWLVATMCIGGCAPPLLGTAARVRLRDKYGLHGSKLRGAFLLWLVCSSALLLIFNPLVMMLVCDCCVTTTDHACTVCC